MNIPIQLQDERFRFIKVAPMGKRPIENDWTNTNHKWNELNGWDGNYGVVCGYGNLAVVDCDKPELLAEIIKNLPKSFTVKTGGGGIHVYYIINDLDKKIVIGTGNDHKGEVQFFGSQVVGVGSTHPNGNKYKIEIDLPIAEITKADLMEVIKPFMKEKKTIGIKTNSQTLSHDLLVTDVIELTEFEYKNGEYQGSHPFHGSTGGSNFMISPSKNLWHCFRCDTGGSALSLLAIKHRIINCGDDLRGEAFKDTLELARKEFPDKMPKDNYEIIDGKPLIKLSKEGRLISEFATDVGNYFANKDLIFYRSIDDTVIKLNENSDGILIFSTIKPAEFITILEHNVTTGIYKMVENKKDENGKVIETDEPKLYFVKKSCRKNDAEITLLSEQFKHKLQRINKIFTVPMPIIRDGELIVPKRGHDKTLMSWLPPEAPKIDKNISLEEAKETIEYIFKEFCFKSEQDKTNSIAALLTPLCRELYERRTCRTPIVLYSANTPRAGKDYLAGITGLIYDGVTNEDPPVSNGQSNNDEELRKKITSVFLSGRNRFHSSNNKGYLNSATFEALATKEFYSDRLLGTNKNVMYPNHLELSLSANTGLSYTTDFSKRCLLIHLFFNEEDPNNRKFENPMLHQWVLEHRSKILSSLYAMIRNWFEQDIPGGSEQFASFPEWARVVGGIMEAAGYNNPCINNENLEDVGGDTKLRDMKTLYNIALNKYSKLWVTKNDIVNDFIAPNSDFDGLFDFIDFHDRVGKSKFGKMFDSFTKRWLGDIKVVTDGNARASRRKYKFVEKSNEKRGIGDYV